MRHSGVVRNSAYLVVAGAAERAGSLVVVLILSRLEGPEGLGVYVTVIAYFQLLTVAAELGVSNYLVREIARDPERTSTWVAHGVVFAFGASTVLVAGALVALPHLGLGTSTREGMTVVLAGVFPAALNVVSRAVFVAHRRVAVDAFANIGASLALVLSGWYLLRGGVGVVGLIAAYVATRVVITLVSFAVIHRSVAPIVLAFDPEFARSMLRGLRPFAGSTVVGALFSRPEVLILAVFVSPAQVGAFGAAFKTIDLWQLVPETYMLNAYPVLTQAHEQDPERANELQRRATTGLLAMGLPISAGLALTAEPVIELLYGPGFEDAVVLLRILSVLGVLFCIHTVLWRSLSARGDQSTVLRVQVRTLVVRLVLGIGLIAAFGAVGAAITIPLVLSIHNGYLARALHRSGGTAVLNASQVWPYAAGTLAMTAALVGVGSTSLLVMVPVGIATYALSVLGFLRLAPPHARPLLSVTLPEREPT